MVGGWVGGLVDYLEKVRDGLRVSEVRKGWIGLD